MNPEMKHSASGNWRRAFFAAASAAALVTGPACTSKSPAPVTYGAAPNAGAYGANASAARPASSASSGYQTAAYRAPVTAVSETYSEGRNATVARPLYLASTQSVSAPQSNSEDLPGSVTVAPGDTVYAISRRTGASPQSIIALNRLSPPYALSVGQTLRVPSNAVPPSAGAQRAAIATSPARSAAEHVVRPGDTLYSLARANGVTVEEIARANRMRQPYELKVGAALVIPGSDGSARVENAVLRREEPAPSADVRQIVKSAAYSKPAPVATVERIFDWPVKGAVIGSYGALSAGKRNEGVNIAAPVGTPVRAAAAGEVVYRGSELDGYGNLLLIKHADGFVTAYAHNDAMLVKKGQIVRQGEVIAKVGQSGAASEPQLHFEIRQNLRSVDPLAFLQ